MARDGRDPTAADFVDCPADEVLRVLCPVGDPIPGIAADQDWGTGATTLTFRDGSRLVVRGSIVEVA